MLVKKLTLAAIAVCFALGGTAARAQDAGALLDLLVKKKLITDQEAEEVRGELVKEYADTSAGKWKLSTPITELELYGDIRLRYNYVGGETKDRGPVASPATGVAGLNDWIERSRERYRLRLGLRGTLMDDWFFGIRLETNASPRSTNVTFGADASSSSPGGGGPFAKGDDIVYVGQAYAGYKGFPDFTFTGGRMPNPLVTTLMVWDPDINPEGLAEQWKHTFTFNIGGGGGEPAPAYSKEGKGIVATPAEPFKLFLRTSHSLFMTIRIRRIRSGPGRPCRLQPEAGLVRLASLSRTPTHTCWLGRWEGDLLSRTTFTFRWRQSSTITLVTAMFLTSTIRAVLLT